MTRKSLVLGPIAVPDADLLSCARGLLDGDGSILNFRYAGSGKARGATYENLVTRFISASYDHIEWLRASLRRVVGVNGSVSKPNACWHLNYAIRESSVLLPQIYEREGVPCLERKWSTWKSYADRHGLPATAQDLSMKRTA
jgi:hypothetical protein